MTTPAITGTGYAVPDTEAPTKPSPTTTPQKQTSPKPNAPLVTHPTRSHYRPRPQQPPVRIDTCIVGDDTTCDMAQNEKCKTDAGVSSCHCRPGKNHYIDRRFLEEIFSNFVHFTGFARRKHREPCRKVVSILMSMRVDKFYERRIIWDKTLTDPNSEAFGHLSYEAIRAVNIS